MSRMSGLAARALPLLAATAVMAQAPAPQGATASQSLVARAGPSLTTRRVEPPVLFWIGAIPVRLWAPVPPPYDATANQDGAANHMATAFANWPPPPTAE